MCLHCQGLSCKINVYKIVVLKRKVEYRMFKINENYLKLPGSYLFSDIGKKLPALYRGASGERNYPSWDWGCNAAIGAGSD